MEFLNGFFRKREIADYRFDINDKLITVAIYPDEKNSILIKLWAFYFSKVMRHIDFSRSKCREVLLSSLKILLENPFTKKTNCFELLGISKVIRYSRVPMTGDIIFTGILSEDSKGTQLNTKFPEKISDVQIIASVFAMLQYVISRCVQNGYDNDMLFNAIKNVYEIYSSGKDETDEIESMTFMELNVTASNSEDENENDFQGAEDTFLLRKAKELSKMVTEKSMDDCIEYCNANIDEKLENITGDTMLKLYYEFAIAYIHYFDRTTMKFENRRKFMEFTISDIVDNIIDKLKVDSSDSEYGNIRKALTEHFNSSMVYYESSKKFSSDSSLDPKNPVFWNYGKQIMSAVNREESFQNVQTCSELFVKGIKKLKISEFGQKMNA